MRTRPLLVLFVLSGCTSLIYEVVFHKLLAYVFGSSLLATSTVLVAFMGGLSLGGRLIGVRADRLRRPVAFYGWLEAAIGVYVLCVPLLLRLCGGLYAYLGVSGDVHAPGHIVLRFLLSCAVLVVPTLLMGGTLPVLAAAIVRGSPRASQELSRLYALNTVGAALGTLLANYVLLPYVGIYGTLGLGAATNACIMWRALRIDAAITVGQTPSSATPPAAVVVPAPTAWTEFALAMPAVFAAGVVSFTLEIVWTHLLATIVGMSVYAFGLMLATFLAGLALGGAIVARVPRFVADRALGVCVSQFALAAVVIGTLPLWDELPIIFARVGEQHPSFAIMELTRAGVCAAMLLPAATSIGMTFPILLSTATLDSERLATRVGLLYALNTLGCVAGAVATGFWLLERFGSRSLLLLCASASLCIGVSHAAIKPTGRGQRTLVAILTAAVLLVLQSRQDAWNWKTLAAGMNVNFSRGARIEEVLWAKEDAQGGVTTITREERGITLRTNGKFQADDHTELVAQQGFALLPLLFVPRYGDALNIGYGSGITAGVLSRFPFRRIEIAELSPAIVEAADRYYAALNFVPSHDPRVRLVYNDGRNHLQVSNRTFDLITVEITSIWFAGAASLYSREFYELCQQHLKRDGVLQQWVQLHHITRRDLLVLWNTLRSVFPYVSLWRQGTQGSLIASFQPQRVRYDQVQAMNQLASAAVVLRRMRVPDFFSLLGAQQLSANEMVEILGELPRYVPRFAVPYAISSDYYPILEYSTPRGYALSDAAELENIAWIGSFQRRPLPELIGVPDALTQRRVELLAAAGARNCALVRRLWADELPEDEALRSVRASCRLWMAPK